MRKTLFLFCLVACSSSPQGLTVPADILLNLSDTRAMLQAYPDGYWELTLRCSTPTGEGAFITHGTWPKAVAAEVKGYAEDPALRTFASPLTGNESCPQGDMDIFKMLLPSNHLVCWRSDPSNPQMPASIVGLEKVFDNLVTSARDAKTCLPLMGPKSPAVDLGMSTAAGAAPMSR